MFASYNWLIELSGVDASPSEVADKLTSLGLEVEDTQRRGHLPGVVVGEVRSKAPHPKRDKLSVLEVFDGEVVETVVCGAPNAPERGKIIFAKVGASLPGGFDIGERKLGGVVSRGMVCGEDEIDIGSDTTGVFVFPEGTDIAPGTPISEALSLEDTIFEISLTPNRPDCLGHIGIARDLALGFGVPFNPPAAPGADTVEALSGDRIEEGSLSATVGIDDPERCPRYGAAIISGVSIGPSPFWLRYRLHLLGVRSIHNVVDATNYVVYEYGHPTHAFDLNKVGGSAIKVRLATEGESIRTLDDQTRTLTSDDLLICDGSGPVAIAGVMGGGDSEIDDNTKDVLLECAYFDPRSVRRTSKRTGLHTDASHRFERGVDESAVPNVMSRTASLIAEVGGGTFSGRWLDVRPAPVARRHTTLRPARYEVVMGASVTSERCAEILTGLGCDVKSSGDVLEVALPLHRPDLSREEDLIEEVARVVGFDQIEAKIPSVRPSAKSAPSHVRFERRLRDAAVAAGLFEAVNYAFVSDAHLASAQAPSDAVRLANPISQDKAVLRTCLLPGLLTAAARASRRQVKDVRLFEVGQVFRPSASGLPNESAQFGVLLSGQSSGWLSAGSPYDFYSVKGVVDSLVRSLFARSVTTQLGERLAEEAPYLHPARRASLLVDGQAIGTCGELHPDVSEAFDVPRPVVVANLSLKKLLELDARLGSPSFRVMPRFPATSRDLALEIADEVEAGRIATIIRESGSTLIEDVELFDVYRGDQVGEGRKSLAFRIVYRDPEETLTDKRVDKAHAGVVKALKNSLDVAVR